MAQLALAVLALEQVAPPRSGAVLELAALAVAPLALTDRYYHRQHLRQQLRPVARGLVDQADYQVVRFDLADSTHFQLRLRYQNELRHQSLHHPERTSEH